MLRKCFCLCFIVLLVAAPILLAAEKSVAGVTFSVPHRWNETEPTSNMRTYQFEIRGDEDGQNAELVVFYFGKGQGGDVNGNIERWKSQFKELKEELTLEKTVGDIKVTQVYFEGSYQLTMGPMMAPHGDPQTDYAMLGAIIHAPEGTVFLKMTGPKNTIAKAKPEFELLLSSLKK